jgi:hypothetical protein
MTMQRSHSTHAYWVIRSTQEAVNATGQEHIWLVLLGHMGLVKPDSQGVASWDFNEIRGAFGLTAGETLDLDSMFQRQRDLGYITQDSATGREHWTV